MAREHGLAIDRESFDVEMEQQRERARASWKGAEKAAVTPAYQKLLEQGRTKFLGYTDVEATSRVVGLIVDKESVQQVPAGARAELVFDQTPFYAESGGQVGDHGVLYAASGEKVADVETAFPGVPGLTVHRIVTAAPVAVGDTLRAEVAVPLRDATRRNHTATHLLHASLRTVLGKHVKQAGSIVDPGRLRFDFTHYAGLDHAELEEVERLMNQEILRNTAVQTDILPLDQAIATGAMALFGEKYGEEVRVVSVPGFSRELCGGTHVQRTGDIGVAKIVYEGSISAGVRRIEAITGEAALRQYQETSGAVKRVADMVKVSEPALIEHVEKMLANERALEKQVEQLKNKLAQAAVGSLDAQAHTIKDVKVVCRAARWHGPSADAGTRRFAAQQVEVRGGGAGIGGRWQCRHHLRGHQRSDRESPRRKAGQQLSRSRGRRQGRRTSRYGGGGRQGPFGARCGAGGGLRGRRRQALSP